MPRTPPSVPADVPAEDIPEEVLSRIEQDQRDHAEQLAAAHEE